MLPVFDNYQENVGGELECPACKHNNLHHERVEVFERSEDQKQGVHCSVSKSGAIFDTNLAGNPSERRHGLIIYFICESCSAKPILTIAQHKGTTYVNFK
ncbi:MAG: hypothetical protein HY611_01140 [Elusimicrobia bacterium]|nr:hypothetical protein [Elusimicrobiota bacterium]